jgi:hypothetical protein
MTESQPAQSARPARTRAAKRPAGPIALVGAGSGDPSLLVVRAADLLRTADVVVADERCAEALLAGVRDDAEVVRTPAGEAQGAALVAASRDGRASCGCCRATRSCTPRAPRRPRPCCAPSSGSRSCRACPTPCRCPAYAGVAVGLPRTVARVDDGTSFAALAAAPARWCC